MVHGGYRGLVRLAPFLSAARPARRKASASAPPGAGSFRGVGGRRGALSGRAAAVPALRLKNLYLAIATLGFGVVLQKIIFEWRDLTGGGGGLALSAPTIAGYELGATGLYYLTLAFVILGLWGAWNVSRGRTGRALRIIKESEIAAASLGIHIARYKVTAFALSAFCAALAGGLFASAAP